MKLSIGRYSLKITPEDRSYPTESSGDWRGKTEEWTTEPPVCGPDDGIPDRVARLKALGNAVIPQIPELIGWMILSV